MEGATGYAVQSNMDEMWDDTDTVSFNGVPFTTETTYTAGELDPATTVYVRVAAVAGTVEAPLVSNFSTHVTGMTTDTASAAPPAPANLRVNATDSDYIEWAWDAVEGASGYQSQFSSTSTFPEGSAGNLWHGAGQTSRRVRLEPQSDGYLRVRTYTGTQAEPTFGDWTAGSMGRTGAPPPPEPLGVPGNLRSTAQGDYSIALAWDDVDDVDHYEVQQRADDGAWVDTSCGGGDNEVEDPVCEATGLDEVTEYDFRVSAVPSSADTHLRASEWATLNNIETTGTRPTPPPTTVPGSDDDLNIIWESTATSITWRWDQVADRDRMYQIHYSEAAYNTKANPCVEPDDATWAAADAAGFATSYKTDTTGVTAFTPDLAAGDVALLCVQTTWEDDRGVTQYGNHSFAWAATTPVLPSLADPAYDDRGGDTKAINWQNVAFDRGFKYELRLVSASPIEDGTAGTTLPAAAPSPAACAAGKELRDEDSGNRAEFSFTAYDVTGLADYTSYHLCYMARNEDGTSRSGWAISTNGGVTLPSQPGSIVGGPSTVDHDDGLEWTFAVPEDGHPQEAASYNINLFQETTEASDEDPKLTGRRNLSAADCEATAAIQNAAGDGNIYYAPTAISTGVTRTRTHIRVVVPTASVTDAETGPNKRNYLCVQSKLDATRVSRWRLSGAVTQRKDPGS